MEKIDDGTAKDAIRGGGSLNQLNLEINNMRERVREQVLIHQADEKFTKREVVALTAMQGLLANPNCEDGPFGVLETAFEFADAFLSASRNEKEKGK